MKGKILSNYSGKVLSSYSGVPSQKKVTVDTREPMMFKDDVYMFKNDIIKMQGDFFNG